MKLLEIHEFNSSDHEDVSRVVIELETKEKTINIQLGEGESEDMYLFRDLSDIYNITVAIKLAYNAGKNGEELEYIFEEEKDN